MENKIGRMTIHQIKMLQNITYYMIFGKPLIVYLGLITFLCLLTTAILGFLALKGKAKMSYHKVFAAITIILGLIHGFFGIMAYF